MIIEGRKTILKLLQNLTFVSSLWRKNPISVGDMVPKEERK